MGCSGNPICAPRAVGQTLAAFAYHQETVLVTPPRLPVVTQLPHMLTLGKQGQGMALNPTLMRNMDNTSSLSQGDQPVNMCVSYQLFNSLFLHLEP